MPRSSFRRLVAGVAAGALAVLVPVALSPAPASAAAGDLFFSEYVEGSSNNKAIEIYNGTGGPVDLAAGGYTVQVFPNGASSANSTTTLSGTVADGDVFVEANSSANDAIKAVADLVTGNANWNGNDAVVLRKGTTVLDVIGQVGVNPGTEWGSSPTSTLNQTLTRLSDICAGDPDGSDAFDPSAQWEGSAIDVVDGLGSHTSSCSGPVVDAAPTVTAITPADGSDASGGVSPTVTFSEPVTLADDAISLSCTGAGDVGVTVGGGPTAYTVSPASALPTGDECTLTVPAAGVSDVDTFDPPDTLVADVTSTFTVVDTCTADFTPIYDIQGSGPAAAITGPVVTRGVVVGDNEGPSPALRGFYLQDVDGDGDAATSDGIFVFNGNADSVSLGDVVTVSGTAEEYQDQTQISTVTSIDTCGTGTVEPTEVTLPVASATALESVEGMLVTMPQTLSVTEHFQLGRFGQVVLSSGGRLQQPTNVVAPGAAALVLQAENDLNRIIVDDDTQAQNPDPIVFGRGGQPLSASNTLRGGDTTTGATGVMTYTWGGNSASPNAFRLRPLGALGGSITFEPTNPRPTTPEEVGGSLRVVGMNLLNYFNTFDGFPDTVDNCTSGVSGGPTDCRGADTQEEFDRQWPKSVAAILALDPDVLGVNEIENDGYGPESAIAHLVDRLNEATAPGTYAFIDADAGTGQVDALGDDAIKVGQIYQPAVVTPVGDTAALNTTEFVNGGDSAPRNRPSLAQAWKVNATGAVFIADTNHLKSKGSACDDPDANDGQANCAMVRTRSANLLADWLATDPTGTGDPDVLLIGDYNSYAKEDPIAALEGAGFTNLVESELGEDAYSYAFDGQWGYLDQALGSASILDQVTGVADHHINADEPSVLDYNTDFKTANLIDSLYAPDQYRMSDHDPVLIGLDLVGPAAPPTAPTVEAAFADGSVGCGVRNAMLAVTFADVNPGDTHDVTVEWGDGRRQTKKSATSPLTLRHTYAASGRYTATVTVRDGSGLSTTTTAEVAVEYASTGILPRLGSKKPVTIRQGAVVPLVVGYVDCSGRLPRDIHPVISVELGGDTVLEQPMTSLGIAWGYLLRTAKLPQSSGTYTVRVTVPETGQSDTGTFRLRR